MWRLGGGHPSKKSLYEMVAPYVGQAKSGRTPLCIEFGPMRRLLRIERSLWCVDPTLKTLVDVRRYWSDVARCYIDLSA